MVVLLFVETFGLCAWAQQDSPVPSEQAEADVEKEAEEKKAAEQARKEAMAVQECQRLVAVAIGKTASPEIHPEILKKITPKNTKLVISIDKKTLTVMVDGVSGLLCPISCGRVGMDTETGDFSVVSKAERAPRDHHYGSLVDSRGNLLLKGVYSNLDPVPEGATFVPSPPNIYIKLTEDVVIHSGDANGTASTDGAIVIPTTAARTLFKLLVAGHPVTIE